MRHTNRQKNKLRKNAVKLAKEEFISNPQINKLANTAWNFAYSTLWNCTQFSSKEINAAKEKITGYLLSGQNPEKTFLAFCQRVVLARQSVSKGAEKHIPLPSVWLDHCNESGFAGTKTSFDEIKNVRASLPAYKAELKALAEAALEFSEEPTTQNYQYWRQYFIDRQTPTLLNLSR